MIECDRDTKMELIDILLLFGKKIYINTLIIISSKQTSHPQIITISIRT
jgi:hypothetical protein